MRILYIRRDDAVPGFRAFLKHQQRQLLFAEQDGFFEASLYAAGDVVECTFHAFERYPDRYRGYDVVVVNLKCGIFSSDAERFARIQQAVSSISAVKALFVGSAKTAYMPPNELLDGFDVVFKREPYRDRERYALSAANTAKIVTTMISCPFRVLARPTVYSLTYTTLFRHEPLPCTRTPVHEVGFSGAVAYEHTLRQDVWDRVLEEGFDVLGGLQTNPYKKEPIPAKLRGERMTGAAYVAALCNARINLALDGIGPYTFRHQELLYLGAFMMSGPSIRELELPMPLMEDVHYITFNDYDDMVDKIRHYLSHETKRQAIAQSGKKLFDQYYNPAQHGKAIARALGS